MDAESVYNLLQRKGLSATVRTYPDATFNPANNTTTLGVAVDYPDTKVIPPYKNKEGYKPAELITMGKGLSGIANYNLQFTVKAGLKIIIAGKEWTVISYTEVKDKTGVLLYLVEIEAGN